MMFALLICNLLIRYPGYLLIETEIQLTESYQLLDDLDEGIIILDKDNNNCEYSNKLAMSLHSFWSNLNVSNEFNANFDNIDIESPK